MGLDMFSLVTGYAEQDWNNLQQVLSLDLIPTQGPLGHSHGPLEVPKPHFETHIATACPFENSHICNCAN